MAEVHISLNGRPYEIACDDGQEGRIVDLAAYIDQRLQHIARSGGAYNDTHLMVLATLVVADELFEARAALKQTENRTKMQKETVVANKADEKAMASVLDQITKRIEGIAARVQTA